MIAILHALLHKATPVACLLALTAMLAGCGPERGEQILPYTHNASLGGGNQLVSLPFTDLRHHPRTQHVVQVRRHPQHF
jgi:hypothetical protein